MLAGGERHKITLMGPSAAGKTSIMHRYSSGSFSEDQVPTIGAAFTSSDIDTSKGKVTLNIWDTAGQERFKSLVPKYARGSSAVIVVFDSTSVNSLKEAQTIVEQESTIYDSKMIWFFVANKSDQEPSDDVAVHPPGDLAGWFQDASLVLLQWPHPTQQRKDVQIHRKLPHCRRRHPAVRCGRYAIRLCRCWRQVGDIIPFSEQSGRCELRCGHCECCHSFADY